MAGAAGAPATQPLGSAAPRPFRGSPRRLLLLATGLAAPSSPSACGWRQARLRSCCVLMGGTAQPAAEAPRAASGGAQRQAERQQLPHPVRAASAQRPPAACPGRGALAARQPRSRRHTQPAAAAAGRGAAGGSVRRPPPALPATACRLRSGGRAARASGPAAASGALPAGRRPCLHSDATGGRRARPFRRQRTSHPGACRV